jgi:hypothetical protein
MGLMGCFGREKRGFFGRYRRVFFNGNIGIGSLRHFMGELGFY